MTSARRGSGRDELSRSLLALREAADLSQTAVGKTTDIGQRKISRFENGLYLPTLEELGSLLRLYQAPPEVADALRSMVIDLRAEVRKPRAVIRRENVASIQHHIGRIEAHATLTQSFHPSIVMGLLQSPPYIRTIFSGADVADAEEAVAARLERQRQMAHSDSRITLVQTEGALRWNLGSPAVMAEQMDHVAELATRSPNVRVGIIPWTTSVPVYVLNGFHIYDRRTVLVGTTAGTTLLNDQSDLDEYLPLFDQLEKLAVFGEGAAAIATRIGAEYRSL